MDGCHVVGGDLLQSGQNEIGRAPDVAKLGETRRIYILAVRSGFLADHKEADRVGGGLGARDYRDIPVANISVINIERMVLAGELFV